MYTFNGGQGNVNLMLELSGLMGDLECPVDVTIQYIDGPKASKLKCLFTLCPIMIVVLYNTASGVDYQPGPLTITIPANSVNGNNFPVSLEILGDSEVEGDHTFSAEVVDSDLVIPGQDTTIQITDNDCE